MTELLQEDCYYKEALDLVLREGKISTSLLQKRFSIGYGRSKKLVALLRNNVFVTSEGKLMSILEASEDYRNLIAYKDISFEEEFRSIANSFIAFDAKYPKAVELARELGYVSINLIKKRLKVGYPRAARIMDVLSVYGVVEINVKGRRSRYLGN